MFILMYFFAVALPCTETALVVVPKNRYDFRIT